MDETQTLQTAPQADTPEAGSEDAALLALQKLGNPDEPNGAVGGEQAEDETDQSGDDPNAEADEGDTDEDTAADLEEVEIEGVRLSLTKEQAQAIQKSTLRQADYSRKMNDVSVKEKQAQQRLQTAELLVGGLEKVAEVKAAIHVFDQQIKQYEGVDWQRLRAEDPATYSMHATDLQNLRLNRAEAEKTANNVEGELAQARAQEFTQKRVEMSKELQKVFGDWDKASYELVAYAESAGVKTETLSQITDPAMVIALDKARKFDALQQSKAALKAKVKEVPQVIKPGAARKTATGSEALNRFRQTRSDDDAVAALMSRRAR